VRRGIGVRQHGAAQALAWPSRVEKEERKEKQRKGRKGEKQRKEKKYGKRKLRWK
jgi:hypothetical protein